VVLLFFEVADDAGDWEDSEDEEAEFVEEVERACEENHGEGVGWGEEGAEDGADGDGVFAVFAHGSWVEDTDPAEHDDDDGCLEGDAEGESHVEDGFDVFADSVLLDDADVGGEVEGADGG